MTSEPHELVSPVATHLPIFLKRSTLSPVLPVTASQGVSAGFARFYFPPKGNLPKIMQEYAAAFCPLRAPVPWIFPYPHLWMSKSSGSDLSDRLATIQTAKALSLVPMNLKCLTLLTAENVHGQNKIEAKRGYFMESPPLTRIGCIANQKIIKKAHFRY